MLEHYRNYKNQNEQLNKCPRNKRGQILLNDKLKSTSNRRGHEVLLRGPRKGRAFDSARRLIMKRIMRIIRIRIKVNKKKRRSADPMKAYRAHLEVQIYTAILNMIIKELKKEEAAADAQAVIATA